MGVQFLQQTDGYLWAKKAVGTQFSREDYYATMTFNDYSPSTVTRYIPKDGSGATIETKIRHEEKAGHAAEWAWWKAGRPYYNVWPAMIETLRNFNSASVPLDSLLNAPERVVTLQFPEPGIDGFRSVMVCLLTAEDFRARIKEAKNIRKGEPFPVYWNDPLTRPGSVTLMTREESAGTIVDPIVGIPEHPFRFGGATFPTSQVTLEQAGIKATPAINMAIAVLLMERTPDIFEPDVLRDDEEKYRSATPERRQELVDKAFRRRGQRGWHVGRELEQIPHYRRPHPALVWTGQGRSIAKVVMRRGCIVKRSVMTKAPTGYLDN